MTRQAKMHDQPAHVSLGIIAWNEERALPATLDALFRQSLFDELSRRGLTCEIICVANGCTDRTALVAEEIFAEQARRHPRAGCFSTRVVDLRERGKINAWNQFVHALSAPEAEVLFLMDADIIIHRPHTLRNMLHVLEQDPSVSVSVDRPCKDVLFKRRRSMGDRLSLSAARLTRAAEAQLSGQLYGIRAALARRIYLPKDLAACDDGFIKALVCTDFLSGQSRADRVRLAPEAEHMFEAYTSPLAVLRNQKRQIIGQTIVHILVDNHLRALPSSERARLADHLRERDREDPAWLKRLIAEHVARTRWSCRLYPGLLGHRLRRLRGLPPREAALCAPAAVAGAALSLVASAMARRALAAGCTDYWPKAAR